MSEHADPADRKRPDLVVQRTTGTLKVGNDNVIQVQVRNRFDRNAGASTTRLEIRRNGQVVFEANLATPPVPGNKSVQVVFRNIAIQAAGPHEVVATADVLDQVDERDETNNTLRTVIQAQ